MASMAKVFGYWLLVGVVAAGAQGNQKAGLWVVASSTRIQQPGEVPANGTILGSTAVAGAGLPVCLTKEVVDSYGVILPPSLKDCELTHVQRTPESFKADMTCKGGYNGLGSVESSWTDPGHVVGKIRFVSKAGPANDARALAWTQESTAVFKSSDCGEVKPRKMPPASAQSK